MSKFIKDFNLSLEMSKMKGRFVDKLYKYGLIGEEKVYYQLNKMPIDMLCAYNIRIKFENEKIQFDYICICKNIIFVIEVKNLLGNICFNKDGSVIREIRKGDQIIKASMDNPINQIENHVNMLRQFLQMRGFTRAIVGIIVMANDKMIITNNSFFENIIKTTDLDKTIFRYIKKERLTLQDEKIGKLLLEYDNEYNYHMVNIIKKNLESQYIPQFSSSIDEELYHELLKLRRKCYVKYNVPACNIFTNKDAELLVLKKPKNKDEFLSIRGFKEKKYDMFGEEIIKIFK